jgi:SAM-dependent methyltransferase
VTEARRSVIYRSAAVYGLAMRALYGRHYRARYTAVAELVPAGASVLELCCGPGVLYRRFLAAKVERYTGLDYSPRFVSLLRRRGVDARLFDVRADGALPVADVVLIQASLYHFLPDSARLIERMRSAARERVIVVEPIRNLTTDHPRLRRLLGRFTDAGTGAQPSRFDEAALDALFASFPGAVERSLLLPGGREKAFVLRGAHPGEGAAA